MLVFAVGCGSGPLFAMLRDRGATVTGLDSSAEMLRLAATRAWHPGEVRRDHGRAALGAFVCFLFFVLEAV